MPHGSSTSFAQTMVNQTPRFDRKRKPLKKRKKKKSATSKYYD
jgi:hypothetical protein